MYIKKAEISEIDLTESYDEPNIENGEHHYYNVKIIITTEDGFNNDHWCIYDQEDNRLYSYDYILNKGIDVPYYCRYLTKDDYSYIYVFKDPEFARRYDKEHEDVYLYYDKNPDELENLRQSFKKIYADTLLD